MINDIFELRSSSTQIHVSLLSNLSVCMHNVYVQKVRSFKKSHIAFEHVLTRCFLKMLHYMFW